ncbi:citramalate synthase [Oceanibacterium hippocampi]|uniref:Citramalate synthase n=1 Tax=Oceanibacterium hippocampi TaxID=745714 RepID=A0A1Y5T5N2_9PROT|nr:citramalate synthase [Oceanibacterium hippocampi]SLN56453.1 2-isopropylmalate synthase [Oceanibacterium hippocampi]
MGRERLYLFDTTLRDGAQTQGVDFSVEDKRTIANALDGLGIDYVEGGWPGANPVDSEFFADVPKLKQARLTAFGMTRRPGRSASNDPGLVAVIETGAVAACLVGKTWDFHVKVALGISLDENVELIADSVRAVRESGREALFDAEHFFDGYQANPDFAIRCLTAAHEAGARWIVLCDTNGGVLPDAVERIVREVTAHVPGDRLGIHCHNDTENAVANSLAAVRAGVRMVQGTLNGIGERCGNANLVSLIPSLVLKAPYRDIVETGITAEALKRLTPTSHLLDEVLNRLPNRHAPYVGSSAFAHKGGLHVSAVQKDPTTYEHVPPEAIGNKRHILVSAQAGKSNILAQLAEIGVDLDPKDKRVGRLLDEVKRREHVGYSYDGALASFGLLARRALDQVPRYFDVSSFRVIVERRHNAKGQLITVSEAIVKIVVDGETIMSAGEGNGPVNALDTALRKDLGKYSHYLADLRLVDFKVRILTAGTEAVTRVLIESTDDTGERWFTVGVSPNIVDASFDALIDSITHKLYRDGAPASVTVTPIELPRTAKR